MTPTALKRVTGVVGTSQLIVTITTVPEDSPAGIVAVNVTKNPSVLGVAVGEGVAIVVVCDNPINPKLKPCNRVPGVAVGVGRIVGVGVGVGRTVGVGVAVGRTVGVGVGVGRTVGVGVVLGSAVAVATAVAIGDAVGVGVAV